MSTPVPVPITARQKEVYDAARRIIATTGRAITLKELAKHLGRAVSTVHIHVHGLARGGLMEQQPRGGWMVLSPEGRSVAQGWTAARSFLQPRIEAAMVEHHASQALQGAVAEIFQAAQEATPC